MLGNAESFLKFKSFVDEIRSTYSYMYAGWECKYQSWQHISQILFHLFHSYQNLARNCFWRYVSTYCRWTREEKIRKDVSSKEVRTYIKKVQKGADCEFNASVVGTTDSPKVFIDERQETETYPNVTFAVVILWWTAKINSILLKIRISLNRANGMCTARCYEAPTRRQRTAQPFITGKLPPSVMCKTTKPTKKRK